MFWANGSDSKDLFKLAMVAVVAVGVGGGWVILQAGEGESWLFVDLEMEFLAMAATAERMDDGGGCPALLNQDLGNGGEALVQPISGGATLDLDAAPQPPHRDLFQVTHQDVHITYQNYRAKHVHSPTSDNGHSRSITLRHPITVNHLISVAGRRPTHTHLTSLVQNSTAYIPVGYRTPKIRPGYPRHQSRTS